MNAQNQRRTSRLQQRSYGKRAIVDAIEIDDMAIRIIGSKNALQAVVADKQTATGMFVVLYAIGAPEGIRTPDPQIRSLVLYPAELPALAIKGRTQSVRLTRIFLRYFKRPPQDGRRDALT